MYKDFFGLQHLPFSLTPDPAFLFLPPKHREALAGLTYAVLERKGFVVLTGDAGTGKTTLINSVLSRLPAERITSSIILNPTLTASEFLEGVMLDFDITDLPASKAQRLWKLQEFLARTHRENRFAVLIVDEAHKLSLEVLEEIRLLGNYESASEKYLQILLLGQSELDTLLNRRDLRQFKQRIELRLYIGPLTPPEVQEYISFRWAKAGGKMAPPFSPEAISQIIQWSQGIPRLVNSLCDNALLMAFGEGSPLVGLNYAREAATNLGLLENPEEPLPALPASPEKTAIRHAATESGPVKPPPAEGAFSASTVRPLDATDSDMPTLAQYGHSRAALFKYLSERFGLPR